MIIKSRCTILESQINHRYLIIIQNKGCFSIMFILQTHCIRAFELLKNSQPNHFEWEVTNFQAICLNLLFKLSIKVEFQGRI